MRIALAHSHPTTFGGGERAMMDVATGLMTRHQVRLIVGRFDPAKTYPGLATFSRQRLRRAAWLTAKPADDVIIANSFGANLLALRNGRRMIYWMHSVRSPFLRHPARQPAFLARRVADWLAVRRDALVVANSAFTAGRISALYGRPAGAIVTPGVDLAAFQPSWPVGSGAVTVGRLSPEKGIERLLDIWRGLPDVALTVVGDGEPSYVARLQAMAPASVVFVGALAPADVAQAYAASRLAVFTPFDEEFGLAPIEAMACGRPVVAYASGGLRETIVDGVTGYLADDGGTFVKRVRSLALPEQAERLGRAAVEHASQFSVERTVASMERLCFQVAGRER